MRAVDPFSYFLEHASAIAGHGGESLSPDPRYCFHTHYEEVRPGPARYRLALGGARASIGELTVRVHAYRLGGMTDVVLVAGARLELSDGLEGDLAVEVRFRAVRDVHYAFYGFFSEPSDLTVGNVQVTLEELEVEDDGGGRPFEEDVATSTLAGRAVGTSASQSSALVLGRSANLEVPVSQDCSLHQLRSREFSASAGASLTGDNALQLWSEIVCRQALLAYGAAMPGLRGLLIGNTSPLLTAFVEDGGMAMHVTEWRPQDGPDALAIHGHFDFLISMVDIAAIEGFEARYESLLQLLSRLLIGGLGLVCIRYSPNDRMPSSATTSEARSLTRNEIGQWVLRLSGTGFSAAPLALAPQAELVLDQAGRTAFVLVLRRL